MGNEAVSLPLKEQATDLYSYETVDTLRPIVSAVRLVTSTGVEYIALVTITLFYEHEEKLASSGLTFAEQGMAYLLKNLRLLVRKTDKVFLLNHTMYFLLPGANLQGAQIVQSRLWEALLWRVHNLSHADGRRPRGMATGYSAYPMYHAHIDEFIEVASRASLHFDWQPEKSMRKSVARHVPPRVESETEGDLPALARKLGIPYLSLLPRKLPQGVQRLVDPKLAQELHCYPLGRERNMLTVAMLNPQDRSALDRLTQETGLHIFPVLTHPQALQTALEQLV